MTVISIAEAAAMLADAQDLCVFTGAGVSAESGIPTFRDGGFWDEYPPDQFANWKGITKLATTNPQRLAEFVHAVVAPIAAAEPNAAHRAIAEREKFSSVQVVTQNVDGLHQRAGCSTVYEVHGSLLGRVNTQGERVASISHAELRGVGERLALKPRTIFGFWRAVRPLMMREGASIVRPSIVLFGDAMAEPDWTLAEQAASSCDAMLTIGTSAQVYPAASLPERARARGVPVITVDLHPPAVGLWVEGRASEVVPAVLLG